MLFIIDASSAYVCRPFVLWLPAPAAQGICARLPRASTDGLLQPDCIWNYVALYHERVVILLSSRFAWRWMSKQPRVLFLFSAWIRCFVQLVFTSSGRRNSVVPSILRHRFMIACSIAHRPFCPANMALQETIKDNDDQHKIPFTRRRHAYSGTDDIRVASHVI